MSSQHPMARTAPHETLIDPRQAIILGSNREKAQELARTLLRENATLLRVLGAVLDKVGPVELDQAVTDEGSTTLFEVEKYDSHDGLTARWVGKRVAG